MEQTLEPLQLCHKVRILTATSLFDGHDVSINLMRRLFQAGGAEVIHLGHNRSAEEIADAAVQEDVQGIAVTSYQGGHMEFFHYLHDLLLAREASHIRIFGGGGATILLSEATELTRSGIVRIFTPDDGRRLGLAGMTREVLQECDFSTHDDALSAVPEQLSRQDKKTLARLISRIEDDPAHAEGLLSRFGTSGSGRRTSIIGVTGPGGSGKSCLVDEIVFRYLRDFPELSIALLSVDPSRTRSGGALLGDRIRINSASDPRVFMRSFATRRANSSISQALGGTIRILTAAGFDLVFVETAGIGQYNTEVVDLADRVLYVMTPEFGSATQLEKIDILDFAHIVVLNKLDRQGGIEALSAVEKQIRWNRQGGGQEVPLVGTVASRIKDPGINRLYSILTLSVNKGTTTATPDSEPQRSQKVDLPIPHDRNGYLREIVFRSRKHDEFVQEQTRLAREWQRIEATRSMLREDSSPELSLRLEQLSRDRERQLDPECRRILDHWEETKQAFRADQYLYQVRGQQLAVDNSFTTVSGLRVPKVAFPDLEDWGDRLQWALRENVPGSFPYTAGVFPFRRQEEDLTRMVVGEGGAERTNRRFHMLTANTAGVRLSTAFDPVTIYGEDPDSRPDIWGRTGISGASIASLDDVKKMYSGFDLCSGKTSSALTINGPAPVMLAFFFNAAIDQQCELYIRRHGLESRVREARKKLHEETNYNPSFHGELPPGNDGLGLMLLGISGDRVLPRETYENIKSAALRSVRGTVQADILKEEQAQNICLFPVEFSLRMMGDIQEYFIKNEIRNFYSVSVSGYHIAEAGAQPVTQLAFALANAFTYVEYFLARGMDIDDFAPNFSFFFSSGMDAEYAVLGRAARRIWAKAIRYRYGGNERSQKLKFHVQTSGRSLQARDIDFNDIRTTLQALGTMFDNCNSIHTNAYDETVTTPTEESVRRALAIQKIISHEYGLARVENPQQGSFLIEILTDLVEKAVYKEFQHLDERGGVLGAMETNYQRIRIQDESLAYEQAKHSGALPIVGVNTFVDGSKSEAQPRGVFRLDPEERRMLIRSIEKWRSCFKSDAQEMTRRLRDVVNGRGNIFECLMEAGKYCSLGQLTHTLYEAGGRHRRIV